MRLSSLLAAVAVLAGSGVAAAQDLERFDTIEAAIESTKKSNKDILVDFTGSDW